MIEDQEFNRLFRTEFKDLSAQLIFQDEDGTYNIFGHYQIVPEKPFYYVYCGATEAGRFSSTRSAMCYIIADKHKLYNLARDILTIDNKIATLQSDIHARAGNGDKATDPNFKEIVEVKLESKIIKKKALEQELAKCINFAKYYEQRGFSNEIARTGSKPNNKTNRKGI